MKNFSIQMTFLTVTAILVFIPFEQLFAQRYLDEVFDDVVVESNVQYGTNASVLAYSIFGEAVPENLLMDVYTPEGDTETNRPLILYFHTGNFLPTPANQSTSGTRTDSITVELCSRFARMGYVVASCSYRLGWNPLAETQRERVNTLINAIYRGVQDSRTAVRFFRKDVAENGNQYDIDPSQIAMFGQGTGGYITLAAATLGEYSEVLLPKFTTEEIVDGTLLEVPMVLEDVNGDIFGTSVGINPLDGDTLCYPNHVGYSSDFNACINLGGAMGDISWLEDGDMPMISFHAPTDPFAPYTTGVLIVPGANLPVVEVSGSGDVQAQVAAFGNNQLFIDAGFNDVWTISNMGSIEGLYPIIRPEGQGSDSSPWDWWADTNPNNANGLLTNPDMSAEKGRAYADTIQGYTAPRLFQALFYERLGCTDQQACNFNPEASYDDNTCLYVDACGNCGGNSIAGCMNENACNFNLEASCDDNTCLFDDACGNCGGNSIAGCMNENACNFNPEASCTDGSCTFPGCTNPIACNFSSIAGCDDGSCITPDGCTVPTACNYDSNAACDDNSCTFPGCTDPETVNYDPTAGCDDGSCIPTFGDFVINAPESILYSDTLEIEVLVNNGQNIYGLFATLEYDNEHFEFVGSTLGDYLGDEVLASPPVDAAGSIEFGASKLGQQAGSNGDGLFYTLQFVPISSVLGAPILVDFSMSASDCFNDDGISGELFLPETLSVELIFEAEVWPGDLNHDGVVDVADILPIGYFYDITGPERPNASLAWEAQNCQIWGTGADFPGDGFYRVFADGNGDGVVNLADQVAVGFNIDQIVSLNAGQSNLEMLAFAQNTSLTVPISNEVTPAQINVPGTETITVQFIATTSAVDAETLFGFTMNIDLSPLGILASDAEIDFSSSEFGVLNESLITQTYGQGSQLNVAITRTSPNSIVGGILLFELTLPLSSSLGANIYTLPVSIGTANDPTGQITLLNAEDVQFAVNSPFGCTDSTACNYNPDATEDNGSCFIVGAACDDNNSETSNDVINEDCICAGEMIVEIILGCTDLNACNYDINANQDDGSCFSIGELCNDNNPATENDVIQNNCLCEGQEILVIFGCTDPAACNFNEEANVDDESCTYVVTYEITGTNIPQAFSTQTYTYTNTTGSTYQWSITGGVIVSGQGSSSIEVVWSSEGGGSIVVVETNEDGCTGDAASFEVVILPTNVFEQTQQSINIFPNPASTSVTITIDESLINSNYQLFDAQGKLVSEGVLTKANTTLNTTGFAAGNYVISIGNDQGVVRQQIIIER